MLSFGRWTGPRAAAMLSVVAVGTGNADRPTAQDTMPHDQTPQPPQTPAADTPPLERLPDGSLRAAAPAKLNLTLQVGPPGTDGFHPLDSLVARVTLHDELIVAQRQDDEVRLTCADPAAGPAEANLVTRAARLLAEHPAAAHVHPRGLDLALHKRIPTGAGLGGGSSDAAAALRALRQLWNLPLSDDELARLGLRLGSDVPLFLGPRSARMTGRGEILRPVELPAFRALLYATPAHASTAAVYREYDRLGSKPIEPLDLQSLRALPPAEWSALLRNDLQRPAERVCPAIAEHAARLAAATGRPVHMTGSGAALFVLCGTAGEADALLERLDPAQRARSQVVTLNPW